MAVHGRLSLDRPRSLSMPFETARSCHYLGVICMRSTEQRLFHGAGQCRHSQAGHNGIGLSASCSVMG
jgi:hypothetical protein